MKKMKYVAQVTTMSHLFVVVPLALASNPSTKARAFNSIHRTSVILAFNRGSAAIPNSEKEDLRALLASLDEESGNVVVSVIAWPDKGADREPMSADDQNLAAERGRAVRQYIESQKSFKEVKVVNVASIDTKGLQGGPSQVVVVVSPPGVAPRDHSVRGAEPNSRPNP